MTPTARKTIARRARVRAAADAEMLFLDLEDLDPGETAAVYVQEMSAMFRERMGELVGDGDDQGEA